MKPEIVNICGVEYTITYCDNPADVDIFKRSSLWGEMDHWTKTIRIYDNGSPIESIWQTLIHEILHGIEEALHLKCFKTEGDKKHHELDSLSIALADTFIRNGWLDVGMKKEFSRDHVHLDERAE